MFVLGPVLQIFKSGARLRDVHMSPRVGYCPTATLFSQLRQTHDVSSVPVRPTSF